jgi:glycosyltransferase involved in cell wall biosynthesis
MGHLLPRRPADVICLSHLRWGFVYQRPNHLMSRAARDRRVFYFEEPLFEEGVSPALRIEAIAPNLVTAVPVLPRGLSPEEVVAGQRALLDELMARYAIHRPLLWFYTPMALAFADHVACSATVFDCMDELAAFDFAPPELVERERALLARSRVVFTGGHSLYEAKRRRHPDVHAFPSGVDAAHFARARERRGAEPDEQRFLTHPRLGFFGVIDERMDRELLAILADAHPAWAIVMIGPVVKIDPGSLPRRPNVHYLGQRPYDALPGHIGGWDVAIMPFAINAATRFISPTKTLEYLAAGRPVVSTPIHDVVHPYGDDGIVRIADRDHFVGAVEQTLAESCAERSARRLAVEEILARTSWDDTWEAMKTLIDPPAPSMTAHRDEALAQPAPRTQPAEEASCTTT